MEIANILPTNCVKPTMMRQDYEMYLTHKVLEHPEVYSFLKDDIKNGISCYKILDNSACELGEGMDFALVLEAAQIIGAHEIVLPDIPRSSKSLTRTLEYLVDLDCKATERYAIAAVAQGETCEQVVSCAAQLLSLKTIHTIMIPKWYSNLDNANGLGRHKLTSAIWELPNFNPEKHHIHWLGLDIGMRELIYSRRYIVRSVDTGYLAALSTPRWSHLSVVAERPRELQIDLENMDVDMMRWEKLVRQANDLIQEK